MAQLSAEIKSNPLHIMYSCTIYVDEVTSIKQWQETAVNSSLEVIIKIFCCLIMRRQQKKKGFVILGFALS